MEPVPKPTPGLWYWRDDTKTLEFSRPPNKTTQKFPEFPELDKRGSSLLRRGAADNRSVTLQDVKGVALKMLEEGERAAMASFSEAEGKQFLDDFLAAMLTYLSGFLEQRANERKAGAFMPRNIEAEQAEADLKIRTEAALRHFARLYCDLLLGSLGGHHMTCGRSRGSATGRDRRLYESLYKFCIKVAWVVFRRKDLTLIEEEVGRLLRSNTFNPALRKPDTATQANGDLPKEKTAKRRTGGKRPARHTMVTQRSPVLASLVPLAKEKSQYLFHYHELHPKVSVGLPGSEPESCPDISAPRVGLLGEAMKLYNHRTLLPLGSEEEEAEEEKRAESLHSSPQSPPRPTTTTGHRSRVISRATTEAAYSMDSD